MNVFVLLVTYFLSGGLILTNGVVAHSEIDCQEARPLVQKIEQDRQTINVAGKMYKIIHVDAQCVTVPKGTI